ncbi:hypothetical protein M5K25_026769 [Dendrobium thyrsiflorum]|uniref:rRNA biogenesis protein RRP36 n=1 Tax=Dendrobium thyrsiflorum TaxID=117978 RepID=A0ABD0TYK2_DENTH
MFFSIVRFASVCVPRFLSSPPGSASSRPVEVAASLALLPFAKPKQLLLPPTERTHTVQFVIILVVKQQENLEQELAHIPFDELQKARADGSHVIRLNTAYMQPDKPGRANKNRPMEMSSKVRVGRYREVIQAPKRVVRDPRFESLCGNLNTEGFRDLAEETRVREKVPSQRRAPVATSLQNVVASDRNVVASASTRRERRRREEVERQRRAGEARGSSWRALVVAPEQNAGRVLLLSYMPGSGIDILSCMRLSFLQRKRMQKLQKLIKKSKDPNIIEDLKNHISWIDKQLKSSSPKNIESEILSEHIKKEKEAAKHGKHPYYLKKSVIRERKLIKKYDELKASGKLDSFIEKKRKKNASKDHRFMPYRKSSDDVQR